MIWAAAAVPMGLLAWVVAPLLADVLTGTAQLAQALIIMLTIGLAWQAVLARIREQPTFHPSAVREALWIRAPRSLHAGQRGGRAWNSS